MNYFEKIHRNLYEMHFKNYKDISNWFEYFKTLYDLGNGELSTFENANYDKYKYTDKWLRNGKISEMFFTFGNKNLLLRNDLFFLFSTKIHNYFEKLSDIDELKSLLYRMLDQPEKLKHPFKFESTIKCKLDAIFNSCDIADFFSVILIFAQTEKILNPYYEKSKIKMVEVYSKTTITDNFTELVQDAIELNMMQISVPSLIEKYNDFYKPNNYNAIIQLLDNGCNINFLFSDLEDELHIQNSVYCSKNEFALYGNVIEDSITFTKDLKNKYPKQIIIKKAPYHIPYSLMIIKKRNAPAIAKVDLYLIKSDADTRHSFIFRSNDNMEGYSLYKNNFFDVFNDDKNIEL